MSLLGTKEITLPKGTKSDISKFCYDATVNTGLCRDNGDSVHILKNKIQFFTLKDGKTYEVFFTDSKYIYGANYDNTTEPGQQIRVVKPIRLD